jgi:hypothetical protein
MPATTMRAGTSRITIAPAANAPSPISIFGLITAPPPIRQPRRSTGPRTSVSRPVAIHGVVVGCDHARADKGVVLDHVPGGQIAVGLHLHPCADVHVVVNGRPRPIRLAARSSLARERTPDPRLSRPPQAPHRRTPQPPRGPRRRRRYWPALTGSRGALEAGPSLGGLPITAPSWITLPWPIEEPA